MGDEWMEGWSMDYRWVKGRRMDGLKGMDRWTDDVWRDYGWVVDGWMGDGKVDELVNDKWMNEWMLLGAWMELKTKGTDDGRTDDKWILQSSARVLLWAGGSRAIRLECCRQTDGPDISRTSGAEGNHNGSSHWA